MNDAEADVLEAAAFLHEETPNSYAYELLRAHLRALSKDEHVAQAVAARRAFRASAEEATTLRFPATAQPESDTDHDARSQNT